MLSDDFRYDIQKGLRPKRSVRTAMANEINMYAIVQKDQMGLDKAIEEVKYRMSRYSVTPNMLYACIRPEHNQSPCVQPTPNLMSPSFLSFAGSSRPSSRSTWRSPRRRS